MYQLIQKRLKTVSLFHILLDQLAYRLEISFFFLVCSTLKFTTYSTAQVNPACISAVSKQAKVTTNLQNVEKSFQIGQRKVREMKVREKSGETVASLTGS